MKNYSVLIMACIIAMMATGCTKQPTAPSVVHDTVDVYKPVPCDIEVTKEDCKYDIGDPDTLSQRLLECITTLKHALQSCTTKK